MSETTHSGPVVLAETIELARYVDVTGTGNRTLMRFSQEIHWVLEHSPQIKFLHGGQLLKDSSYHDCGDYMSCLNSAIDAALGQCKHFGVTTESSLAIDVIITVDRFPVIRRQDSHERKIFGRYSYTSIPDDWHIYDKVKADEVAAYNAALEAGTASSLQWPIGLSHLRSKQVDQKVIWSSKLPEAINALVLHHYKQKWSIPSITPQDKKAA